MPHFNYDDIRRVYDTQAGTGVSGRGRMTKTARIVGCSLPTVIRAIRNGDQRNDGSNTAQGPSKRKSAPVALAREHPAVMERRSLFPTMRRTVAEEGRVLKSGAHSAKLGAIVQKGAWQGMPIFALTLEERATCPTTCALWAGCYGNGTPFARRMVHGPELEHAIRDEVRWLSTKWPKGFVVRLHNLGDFYSVQYVNMWLTLIATTPALRVFGYTAHISLDGSDAIAIAIDRGRVLWPRFAIRRSGGWSTERTTVVIEHVAGKPDDAIICPAQTEQSTSCATCALCWSTEKRIAFLRH